MNQQAESSSTSPNAVTSNRLVLALILIGLGIPILIEAVTLVRLIGGHLVGREDGRSGGSDASAIVMVEEGDELLPATAATETIARMSVRAQLNAWYFVFEVDVHNAGDHPYELVLSALETQHERTVDETYTQRFASGDSMRMRVEWEMPEGDRPMSMHVAGRRLGTADSTTQQAARRVHFDRIPVRMWD